MPINWSESSGEYISLAEGKKQTETEDSCSKGLSELHHGRNLVVFIGFRLQAVINCKGIATKYQNWQFIAMQMNLL